MIAAIPKEEPMPEVALYEVENAVATVTMNRPDRMNALTLEMLELLPELVRRAAHDPDVRCVVLTGAGDRAFSAGADLAPPADRSPIERAAEPLEASIDRLQRQHDVSYLLHTMPKPTIAAINGAAAGASLSMAFACDFRVAAEHAMLRTAFSGIGFSGDFGSSYFLTHMVGSARARELMLLAEKISAADALALGLVTRVVADDRFRDEVAALAARLAEGPPLAYRYMKRNINLAEAGAHLRTILDLEAEAMMRTGRSEDFAAGARAFLRKEQPAFRGR
jgi:2-(1,2-epoxy-1,2-dihydrophenyl)acetyl-CoA isomerase